MKLHRLTLILLLAAAGCATPTKSTPTTVIVVRHGEKALEPKADPPLTEAGTARAALLSETLKGMPVTAVFSTGYARTRSTGAPTAQRLGLTPQLVDAKAADHAQQVARTVLDGHRGQTVLVVGHSNTVPDIVAALGAPKPAAICDQEYDNLFIVRVPASGPATVEAKKYGATSDDHTCRQLK